MLRMGLVLITRLFVQVGQVKGFLGRTAGVTGSDAILDGLLDKVRADNGLGADIEFEVIHGKGYGQRGFLRKAYSAGWCQVPLLTLKGS